MTRTLTGGMQTEIAAQTGSIAHLVQIDSSGGTIRLATTPVDVTALSQTWEGIGGLVQFSAADETGDPTGQGIELVLSGVEQTFISTLLNNQMRGQEVRIWLVHYSSTYTVVADPLEVFRGRQLSDYRITEQRPETGPGTVEIRTQIVSHLATLRNPEAVHSNAISHNDMLERAGLPTGGANTDTFFRNVLGITGKPILWGPGSAILRHLGITR